MQGSRGAGARGQRRATPGASRSWLFALILLLSAAATAAADDPATGPWVERWLKQPTLTGDWFGVRERLAALGITPSISYQTDLLANPLGGQRQSTAYAGQFSAGVTLDLDKLAGLAGLSFSVSGNWASGTDLSSSIGNQLNVAQAFDGRQVRLSTLFLRQTFFDGRLDIKVGRFATSDDFLSGLTLLNLGVVNASMNPPLNAVQINVPSVTEGPNATWGGRVIVRPTGRLSLAAGAYYSDPTLDQLTASGTEFGIDARNGYFVIGDVGYDLNREKGATSLPGRYHVGGYYDSNRYASFTDPGRQGRGNYGFYVTGEQMVYREGEAPSEQGLTVFATFIYAPRQGINTMPYFASAGLGYRGLLPGRDSDVAGFALYYGGFSRYLPGQTYEFVLEWTYAIAVTPWLVVQPDVQYVIKPKGLSSVPNALVVGGQFMVQF